MLSIEKVTLKTRKINYGGWFPLQQGVCLNFVNCLTLFKSIQTLQ